MATKANKPAVAQTGNAPAMDMASMMAMMQQLLAAQAAPAAKAPAAKVVTVAAPAATGDNGEVVEAAAKAAGGKVTRRGASGVTKKGQPKAWLDVTFGGIRIQGNAWVVAAKK